MKKFLFVMLVGVVMMLGVSMAPAQSTIIKEYIEPAVAPESASDPDNVVDASALTTVTLATTHTIAIGTFDVPRNLRVVLTNPSGTLSVRVKIDGTDQFGDTATTTFLMSGAATTQTTVQQIFNTVTLVTTWTTGSPSGSDVINVGYGNRLGVTTAVAGYSLWKVQENGADATSGASYSNQWKSFTPAADVVANDRFVLYFRLANVPLPRE